MDYEKKYKETLKKIENLRGYSLECNNMIDELFPELAESEDELMRKEAISIIRQYNIICEREGDKCYTADRVIAWLEKQVEKPNNAYDKELSEILGCVIRRYINDPNISYSEREKVSREIIPYVERLEKQGEQNPAWSDDDKERIKQICDDLKCGL